jgi:AraC-like DNA-binding protein
MGYRELPPHPALRPYVDRFWVSEVGADAAPRLILPDGCIDVLVDLDRGAEPVAVGTMTRAVVFAPRAPVRTVAVRFRPGAAAAFLGVAADELTDRVASGAELGLGWLRSGRPGGSAGLAGAARALEQLVLDRARAVRAPDPIVAHAVSALFGARPPSIEQLSRELGWSRQHLRRRFRQEVGIGPKQLARVARLQRTVDWLQRRPALGLAESALALGFFDQAHMARDVGELAGVTPADVQASAGSIFPIRSLLDPA